MVKLLRSKVFLRFKRIKNELRVAVLKERLSTPSIRSIKSDKLGQTNVNEFLDDVVMKKARPTHF